MRYLSNGLRMMMIASIILFSFATIWAQESPEGETVSINDFQMYYEIVGDGHPLVLLHGFTGSGKSWQRYSADLMKHYRLIIPDLRGHGHSTNSTNQFTHKQSALDVFKLLDTLKIVRFKAMGTSTGGMTLIHMATQQPDRVEAMVLIGATSYFPEQAREIMRQTSPDSISPQRMEVLQQRHVHGEEQIRSLLTQFHNFKDSYSDMNFTASYLSTITSRTLIVHGDRDRFFPVSIPTDMYRSIPHAYLWIVPDGGHFPIGGNNASIFTEKALEFLAGDWEKN